MQKSYYAIIPANVRYDKDLTPNAKLLYGEITALCNERGYCWAGNGYFSDLYKVSKKSVSTWINQLISKGYITSELVYKEGSKEILYRYLRIVLGGMEENVNTPMEEKVIDNNTSFNNTFNITTTTNAFQFYEQNFGMLSSHLMQDISAWVDDFNGNEDIIIEALKISLERNKRNWGYTKAILKDWHGKGAKTLSDVQALDNEHKPKGSGQTGKHKEPTPYDNIF
ncbi:DnaD domain protein [Rossellomorea aquimaris]|uniref:DnaD domain protein n=1 Tax=Rossellomorea aquimaris TaxID=189382 RepID=UPI0011E8B9D5|nr:DnaD domain protein [Rossellomorea aquimaris]TYS91929.1 DnaD domain protein [Rossellomorea aquimaris]